MIRRSRQSGFALLLTLLLVLLAGVALAGLARRSMVTALDAQQAANELQRRWATTSCREALLGRAEQLLTAVDTAGQADQAPPATRTIDCQLAGLDYRLVVTDEQAKLNVNRLLRQGDRAEAESTLAKLLRSTGAQGVAASLRMRTQTTRSNATNSRSGEVVGAYGQLFDAPRPTTLIGATGGQAAAASITCWGSGMLNVWRAEPDVLAAACGDVLNRSEVDALVAARNSHTDNRKLGALLGGIKRLDDTQKSKLQLLLTDASVCHGLWIIASDERRSWHTLSVADTDDTGAIRHQYDFAW